MRLAKLKASHEIAAVTLTDKQKYDAIKNGKVKLRTDRCAISWHTNANDIFDFEPFEKPARFKAGYEAKRDKIKAEGDALIDKVQLGTGVEALELIQKYAKG